MKMKRHRGRPTQCRRVTGEPPVGVYKPAGQPLRELELISVSLDELEAIKLVDLEGLYHETAGARMGISRATLGRILASAHRKVAQALVSGQALSIQGGEVEFVDAEREES